MICEINEFINGDIEMFNSRDSYSVNFEWFSFILVRVSSARVVRRIMFILVGLKGGFCMWSRLVWFCWNCVVVRLFFRKFRRLSMLFFCIVMVRVVRLSFCVRLVSSITVIFRYIGFFRLLRKRIMVLYNFFRRLKGGVVRIRFILLFWMLSLLRVFKISFWGERTVLGFRVEKGFWVLVEG